MEATTPGQLKGLRIITSCVTEDEFVAAFHSHCDERSVFVPTTIARPMGAQCPFSFRLADGSALLRGVGTVLAAWTDDDNPFGRPGIHLGITQLTSHSEPVFERLLIAREVANQRESAAEGSGGTRHRRAKPMTRPLFGLTPAASTRTEEMTAAHEELGAPVATPSPSVESTAPAKVTRQFGSAYPEPPPTARHRTVNPLTPRPWWMTGRTISVFASGIVFGLLISLLFRSSGSSNRAEVATKSEGTEQRAKVASSEMASAEPPTTPPQVEIATTTAPAQRPSMPTPAKKRMATAPAKKPSPAAAKAAVASQPARQSVAAMLPKPMVSGHTPTRSPAVATTKSAPTKPAAAKPTTTRSVTTTAAKPTTTKSATTTAAKPTTTRSVTAAATKSTTSATTKKSATATKSATTTRPPASATAKATTTKSVTASAKPTTTKSKPTTKPSAVATAKPNASRKPAAGKPAAKTSVAVKPRPKSKRTGCASLDCL